MKTTTSNIFRGFAAVVLLSAAACGDDTAKIDGGHTGSDAGSGSNIDGSPQPVAFHQVEQLARPGINEALLITNDFLNGYNATAPAFTGVDSTTLTAVVGEAKTVLKAIYLGSCLLNGTVPGLTADTGVHPAGMKCHAIGPAIWTENSLTGVTLTQASKDASQAYADAVFGLFEPDVMRVDTSVASFYFTPCGGTTGPALCGGRFINDDVIDTTYDFLINGGGNLPGKGTQYNQFTALVSDGVQYSTKAGQNHGNNTPPDPSNPNQFHPDADQNFPYSAAPF